MLSLTKPSFPDGGYWRKIHTQDIGKKLDIAEVDMIEAKDCWENFFLPAVAVVGGWLSLNCPIQQVVS